MPKTPSASRSVSHSVPPRRGVRPWIIVAALASIGMGGALTYARSAAAIVLYHFLTDGLIALAWAASATGMGAVLLRRWERLSAEEREDRSDPLLYIATGAALGLGLIGLAVLGLGLAGWLNRITAIVLLVPGFALGGLALRGMTGATHNDRAVPRTHSRSVNEPGRAGNETTTRASTWNWLWLAAGPFLALALIGTMVPPGLLWTPEEPHGYDVVEYHLQVPREWFEAGRIVPLRHNVFSYFPMGVEMHYLLAMHLQGGPWDGMYLAQLMHLLLIALASLAVGGVARQFASSRAAAILAAVAFATIPFNAQLAAIAYNEGGLLLFGTLAVGWAMRAMTSSAGSHSQLRRFALAGVMAGFACGTKLTAVPELLLGVPALCALVLFLARRVNAGTGDAESRRHGDAVMKAGAWSGKHDLTASPHLRVPASLGIYIVSSLLVFSPWLVRNAVWTGNPVFPEAAQLLGKAHWTDAQVARWQRANHEPGIAERGVAGHARAAWDQVLGNWQFGYVLLPLGAIAGILLARSGRLRDPTMLLPVLMLLFLAIFWLGFTHLQGRFFLLAAPLAAILVAQVDWGRAMPAVAGLVLLAAAVGWWGLNRRIVGSVWRVTPDGSTMTDALGRHALGWLNPDGLENFPKSAEALRNQPNAHLTLIGDGKAFYYQIPMTRLRYRTVFDVDTTGLPATPDGEALIAAWSGHLKGTNPDPFEWLVEDGAELERFSKTYADIPPPPKAWVKAPEAKVVPGSK